MFVSIVIGILLACASYTPESAAGNQKPVRREGGTARAGWVAPFAGDAHQNKRPCPLVRSTFSLDEEPVAGTVRIIGLGF